MLLVAPPYSYRTRAYLDAAAALGLPVAVASSGTHSLVPEIAQGIQVDLDDAEAAVAAVAADPRASQWAAVVGTDDATVEIACHIARRLGLDHNPVEAARTARRKDLARRVLRDAGCPVPDFRTVDLREALAPQLEALAYPCVLKPLALSASRGVIRVDDPGAAASACRRIGAIVAGSPDPWEANVVLAEAYVDGEEIALEGILADGELEVLAVFDKPDPLQGPYFEETFYVTPSRHDTSVLARARAVVGGACAAYGLRRGPVHAELRVRDGEPWLLEVAARTIGGDCARLLSSGAGASLEELVLANALGDDIAHGLPDGAAGVLMLPTPAAGTLRRVEGVLSAMAVPGVEDVVIAVREGYELVPLPEGSSYLGFVFARGPDPASVEDALREAHAHLRIVVSPAWRLEPGLAVGPPATA